MKTVTQANLAKLQADGAKVRKKIGSRPTKKETPVEVEVETQKGEVEVEIDMSIVARSVEAAANIMKSAMDSNNKAILALHAKLVEKNDPAPRAYKFTIHRDSYGYIETVDAVPGGAK